MSSELDDVSQAKGPREYKSPLEKPPATAVGEAAPQADISLTDTVSGDTVSGDTLVVPRAAATAGPERTESRAATAFQASSAQADTTQASLPQADGSQTQQIWFVELRSRLDNLPGEFKELGEELRGLVGQIVVLDSKMALARTRIVLELMMSDVYERRFQAPAGRRSLDELINGLAKYQQIPREVQGDAHSVRILGNPGAHPGYKVTVEEIGSAVTKLLPVLDWYVEARRSGTLDRDTDRPLSKPSVEIRRSTGRALSIVPKGLRSFDARDRKFFLELLPGPRYEEGLPESIRLWKDRIETDRETPFTVGVVYGPSGCGKSSLLKAGLLPNLDEARVRSVYLEASANGTEQRLLNSLRKRCTALPPDLDLKQSIEAVCQGKGFNKNKKQKVFIVLDQFEQWLHAHRSEENTELARALRQCDGERVQAVLMVREDFFGAVSRFMDELNIVLKQGQNLARVDLFDLPHAGKVLTAFGMGYGRLQEELTPDQEAFVEQAVQGLAEDGRVICVRLALFAEMVKDKPWTPQTLEQVGGAAGVGTTFLEETFSATTADAKCRAHQHAARAVLKALLPEEGSDIRGQARPVSELLAASGYQNRPKDFAELMEILDAELRLITPAAAADAAAADDEETDSGKPATPVGHANPATNGQCYQLTHDFLVPALRVWLDRKQRETRSGRAGLLIASRASMWKIKRENRFLPSPREYVVIRTLTDERTWTPIQHEMMQRARRVHLQHGAALLGVLAVLGAAAFFIVRRIKDAQDTQHATALVEALGNDELVNVGDTVQQLKTYQLQAEPMLLQARLNAGNDDQRRLKTSLALALLRVDTSPSQINYLDVSLLNADAIAFPTLRDLLKPFGEDLSTSLWTVLENGNGPPDKRFQAACALAAYLQDSDAAGIERWKKSAGFVADFLVKKVAQNETAWIEALSPRKNELVDALAVIYRDPSRLPSEHAAATNIVAKYAQDVPDKLAGLVADAGADSNSFIVLYNSITANGQRPVGLLAGQLDIPLDAKAKDPDLEAYASHVANAAVALLRLREVDKVLPLLGRAKDPNDPLARSYPRVRSYLIYRLAPFAGTEPNLTDLLIKQFNQETDPLVLQALMLTLGEFPDAHLSADAGQRLLTLYRTAPESGVRAAAEWLLRKWGQENQLAQADQELMKNPPLEGQSWYVNNQGQTMVIIPAPGKVTVGSPFTEPNRDAGKVEDQHPAKIDNAFAIAAHEVTLGEFLKLFPQYQPDVEYSAPAVAGSPTAISCVDPKTKKTFFVDSRSPVNKVSWYQAAEYCNRLSGKEHLAECYKPNAAGQFAAGMQPYDDFLKRNGYRLPTEAEWEWACRAGTSTSRYYGQADELLPKYAWYATDAANHLQPVGRLKPNDWGLFDTLGNALEWCQDYCQSKDTNFVGRLDPAPVQDGQIRIARSEKFLSLLVNVRAARRDYKHGPEKEDFIMGFRPARTYP